jgi:hypothetical protein
MHGLIFVKGKCIGVPCRVSIKQSRQWCVR